MKLRLFFLLVICFIYSIRCNSQEPTILLNDKESLDIALDNIIKKDLYENQNNNVTIVFSLKIDSKGEVHSAHIRWYKNIDFKDFYTICNAIETNFKLVFLYDRYKDSFPEKKYVTCRYSYCSLRDP